MKTTFKLLLASTALTAAVGVPAWSAMQIGAGGGLRPIAALFEDGADAMPIILVSDDDDDHREYARRGHDDDDDDDDECDDDDDPCISGAGNPAPAGTVAPPQNGLFGNGSPPQVQVN